MGAVGSVDMSAARLDVEDGIVECLKYWVAKVDVLGH